MGRLKWFMNIVERGLYLGGDPTATPIELWNVVRQRNSFHLAPAAAWYEDFRKECEHDTQVVSGIDAERLLKSVPLDTVLQVSS